MEFKVGDRVVNDDGFVGVVRQYSPSGQDDPYPLFVAFRKSSYSDWYTVDGREFVGREVTIRHRTPLDEVLE